MCAQREEVMKQLKAKTSQLNEAVRLFFQGKSLREISRRTGMPLASVHRIFKGVDKEELRINRIGKSDSGSSKSFSNPVDPVNSNIPSPEPTEVLPIVLVSPSNSYKGRRRERDSSLSEMIREAEETIIDMLYLKILFQSVEEEHGLSLEDVLKFAILIQSMVR
jgi:hypothetical protein